MSRINKLYNAYNEGNITELELMLQLMLAVTSETVGEIDQLPADILLSVREYVNRMPTTEEGWGKMRTFRICMWSRNITQEQIEESERQERIFHRRGVDLLRSHWKM
jgi:hypothetical protein